MELRLNPKKSQISMEFTLVFVIVLVVALVALKAFQTRLSEMEDREDFIYMQNLASTIQKEILLASQVNDNYIRRFEIPYKLNGKSYTLKLDKAELIVNITEEDDKALYAIMPWEVKGSFIESNEPEFLDYCISKNNNEIRVARNQVSLDYAAYDKDNDGFDQNDYEFAASLRDVLNANKNQKFRISLAVNCVFDLQTIDFDLFFDNEKVDYAKALKPIDKGQIFSGNNYLLSSWIGSAYYYEIEQCGEGCRHITIIKSGKGPLGSGNVVEFEFQTKEEGLTNLEIKNLKLIDASISPDKGGFIPPSAVGNVVKII